nr:hypothetical protein [Tanacetum cinerariifolium]
EYYACAMGEAAPKPKASARKKKGKQPLRAKTPVEPTDLQRTEAEQLKIVLKWRRQETHISQQSVTKSGGESKEEKETSEEEEGSFDPIPGTPEDSENESDDEEEQESRLSEEARIQ